MNAASRTTDPPAPAPDWATRLEALRAETREVDAAVAGRRFLSVGGTGFVGRYLVEELLARGAAEVRILCRTPPRGAHHPRVTFATGNVTRPEVARAACRGMDAVIHSAAVYGNPPFGSLGPGQDVADTNVRGVESSLAAARAESVADFVYTSSANVVFDGTPRLEADESTPYAMGRRLDHYTRSKIAAERLVLAANGGGLRTGILRPNGIYGPREQYITGKVVPLVRMLRGLPFSLDPSQRTDWTFVYNLVWAHLLWLRRVREAPAEVAGKAYFITDGEAVHTLQDVVGAMVRGLGYPGRAFVRVPRFLMVGGCAVQERLCWWLRDLGLRPLFTRTEALKAVTTNTHSIERARTLLGYRPLVGTAEGLGYMGAELRARGEPDGH
ncbi:MAG TPA: NAD-dependent epimerase/dehydratase family protein [Myxococcota bacterium]|nr:NAD-dependent epimerase/dehydratase family protein [Myxococcota bacterium]HRY94567.1 NAD-dependent epimerase/dehydratase family protein [Myxococcota bacterium]HSA20167.1 NAD-dependent epimerase/dehydratase family protein [Myxococcota bacterium]